MNHLSLIGRSRPLFETDVAARGKTIDEIVGQQHLLAPGSPLRRLAEGTAAMSVSDPREAFRPEPAGYFSSLSVIGQFHGEYILCQMKFEPEVTLNSAPVRRALSDLILFLQARKPAREDEASSLT